MAKHRHALGLSLTGSDIDLGNNLHTHPVMGGGETSADMYGPGHKHTYKDVKTGPPIPVGPEMPDDYQAMGKKKKKRKRKSPNKKSNWGY